MLLLPFFTTRVRKTCEFVGAADHALVQSQSAQSSASLEVQAIRDAPQ
jgi:hypothetical protein